MSELLGALYHKVFRSHPSYNKGLDPISTCVRCALIKYKPFGTKLTITGNPMKDGRPAAIWIKAVRADGKVFSLRGRDAQQ